MSLTEKATVEGGGNPLEQVVGVFAKYLDAKSHYLVGIAL
jgi:hypothetical protein